MVNVLQYIKQKKEKFRRYKSDRRAEAIIDNQKKLNELKEKRHLEELKVRADKEREKIRSMRSSRSKLASFSSGLANTLNKTKSTSNSSLGNLNSGSKGNFGGERNIDFGGSGSPFNSNNNGLSFGVSKVDVRRKK